MKPLPLHSVDLLAQLEVTFPEKCPDPNDSEREIWMKAGARRLVNSLKLRLGEANKGLPKLLDFESEE